MTEQKKRRFRFFNVKGWMGYDQLKKSTTSMTSYTKDLFSKPKMGEPETFEEAMVRMGLTEEDLNHREKTCRKYLFFFAGLGGLLLFYSLFLLINGDVRNTFLCLGISAFLFVQAFKQHFWLYQIRERRLGCTMQEWWNSITKKS